MESKSSTKHIFPCLRKMTALHQNMANCQNTLTVLTLRWAVSLRDISVDRMCMTNSSTIQERERNVLFNDALNTFYLRLYGVRHMVKDHSDSEKGNPLPPHRLLLSINSKGSFICTIPQTG